MQVMIVPSAAVDFSFDSACSSPYLSAPSKPPRFGNRFYSAPTSPTRASAAATAAALSSVPFHWEERPGIPKAITTTASFNYGDAGDELPDTDFAFDFGGHQETNSLPADQLFDGGKIRPLKPPPRFQYDQNRPPDSPKSPHSPGRIIREAFSPRHRRIDFDPFAAALEETRKGNDNRGRERTCNTSSTRTKPSRSLSPFRVSDLLFDHEPARTPPPSTSNSTSFSFSSFWYNKKWKIKDLLLFRSASESRATDKQQLKKCALLKKPRQDDVNSSSFRSTDSVGSVSSRRRSGPPISAHELHYTVNRAVSEEMKKRTSLPYKQGLLGCLGFRPTVPEFSKGLSPTAPLSRG